jgi:hypothetical protein
MKVVINTVHGGFGLSEKAMLELERRGVIELLRTDSTFCPILIDEPDEDSNKFRSHPEIIKIVEEMGEDSFGDYAKLEIVEIPDDIDWYIEEYDGLEWVAEKHRTWG